MVRCTQSLLVNACHMDTPCTAQPGAHTLSCADAQQSPSVAGHSKAPMGKPACTTAQANCSHHLCHTTATSTPVAPAHHTPGDTTTRPCWCDTASKVQPCVRYNFDRLNGRRSVTHVCLSACPSDNPETGSARSPERHSRASACRPLVPCLCLPQMTNARQPWHTNSRCCGTPQA